MPVISHRRAKSAPMARHDVPVAVPPSFEEQVGYYYGLPSRPKLVARSSTDPWVDKFNFATQ